MLLFNSYTCFGKRFQKPFAEEFLLYAQKNGHFFIIPFLGFNSVASSDILAISDILASSDILAISDILAKSDILA